MSSLNGVVSFRSRVPVFTGSQRASLADRLGWHGLLFALEQVVCDAQGGGCGGSEGTADRGG